MKVIFTTENIVSNMIIALVLYLMFDFIYLKIAKDVVYPKEFLKNVEIKFGFIAWVALAFAISIAKCETSQDAFMYGSLIGFVSYAVYNGTELAINEYYRRKLWYIDIMYGTLLSGLICFALSFLNRTGQ